MLGVKTRVAAVKVDSDGFRRNNHVSLHSFASWSTTFLGNGAAENHQAVFAWVFEELESLLHFYDGFLHVFACGGGFDVGCCAVFVSEHVYGVADLFAWWNVNCNQFCVAAFFAG